MIYLKSTDHRLFFLAHEKWIFFRVCTEDSLQSVVHNTLINVQTCRISLALRSLCSLFILLPLSSCSPRALSCLSLSSMSALICSKVCTRWASSSCLLRASRADRCLNTWSSSVCEREPANIQWIYPGFFSWQLLPLSKLKMHSFTWIRKSMWAKCDLNTSRCAVSLQKPRSCPQRSKKANKRNLEKLQYNVSVCRISNEAKNVVNF